MSINWNFGDQRAIETKSTFTKDADAAFDEFCKTYLNSSNGFFMSTPVSSTSKSFSSDNHHFDNIDSFISKLSGTKSLNSNNRPFIIEKHDSSNDQNKTSKSAANTISFKDSFPYFNNDNDSYKKPAEIVIEPEPRKSYEKKLDKIHDVLTKMNLDSLNTNVATNPNFIVHKLSPKSNQIKNSEDILINLRLKAPKNRSKRRSIENLMETFQEFNKINKITQLLPPQIAEETSAAGRASSTNQASLQSLKNEVDLMTLEKNQQYSTGDKGLLTKSVKIKSSESLKQSSGDQTRPKSFYGYPNNFYIEKYLESSYKTIDIIDHLNEFNKNYEQMNKQSQMNNSVGESDFSAINKYSELTLNEDVSKKSSQSDEELTKIKNISDTILIAQLNNMNQLQQESKSLSKKPSEVNFIVNIDGNANVDVTKVEEPITYRNLLENEAKRESASLQAALNEKSFRVNNQLESENDYNRISYLEKLATQEPPIQTNEDSYYFATPDSYADYSQENRYKKPNCVFEGDFNNLMSEIPKKKSFCGKIYFNIFPN